MAKQTIKQRKAIRSAAAKKGWETREDKRHAKFIADHQRAYKAGYDFAESMHRVNAACDREMIAADLGHPLLVPAPIVIKASTWEEARALSQTMKPNVTVELPKSAPLRPSLWQRIKGWVLRAA